LPTAAAAMFASWFYQNLSLFSIEVMICGICIMAPVQDLMASLPAETHFFCFYLLIFLIEMLQNVAGNVV